MTKLRAWLLNLGLIAGSVALTVVAAEGALRLVDARTLLRPTLMPPGIARHFETDEFSTTVTINGQGLRDAREPTPDHPGRYRIAAVGDSFTYGWGVNDDETYPVRLEAELEARGLDRVEVINVGRPGQSPTDYLRNLDQQAMPLNPDLVIVGFVPGNDCPLDVDLGDGSDAAVAARAQALISGALDPWRGAGWRIGRLVNARLTKPLRAWAKSVGGDAGADDGLARDPVDGGANPLSPRRLAGPLANNPAVKARYETLKAKGWVGKGERWEVSPWLINMALFNPDYQARALLPPDDRATDGQWRVCERILAAMAERARAGGADFALLVVASPAQVSPAYLAVRRDLGIAIPEAVLTSTAVNDRLADFCAREGLRCVDALDATRRAAAEGTRLFHPVDGHPNAAGQAVVAETLAEALADAIPSP